MRRASLLGLLLVLTLGGCRADPISPPVTPAVVPDPGPPSSGSTALVVRVSDGDSLVVSTDEGEARVRLIGVNTPEADECFGAEAAGILDDLTAGRRVLLVTDVEPFDQYGRILAYVYLDDVLINAEIVRRGAALARAYEPNTTLQSALDDAEQQARNQQVGMWSPTACGAPPPQVGTVVILSVDADAPGRDHENLNGERVVIENRGQEAVDLEGWILKDESSVHRLVFEGVVLGAGRTLVVFTGCGDNSPDEVYWCEPTPVWDNAGDTAFLLAPSGSIVDLYEY